MPNTRILGTGHYVPPLVWTNTDLEKVMDTSDKWIRQRTGIEERHIAEPGVGVADLAVEASKPAIERAGLKPEDIDLIIFCTLSPEYPFPGGGVLLQRKMPFGEIGAIDIRAQCSGFIYGLSVADAFIKTGMHKHVLLVGSEIHSNLLDWSTEGRNMACLFGDGAGAVVLGATDEPGVISTHLHSDGQFAESLYMEKPGSLAQSYITHEDLDAKKHFPHMEGSTVFKNAVRRFREAVTEALETNNATVDDVDLFVFHQANKRICMAIGESLGIPGEKIFINIEKYGNTTAASIPICLNEAVQEERIQRGNLICMAAFGAGFTWASSLIRW